MDYIILILFLHFVGDFVFQNQWMAENKADNAWVCIVHSLVYGAFFAPFGLVALIIAFAHFAIDNASSQLTKSLWEKKDWHTFFIVIGFDQLLHISLAIIIITKQWEII